MWEAVTPVISMYEEGAMPYQPDSARTWAFSLPGTKMLVVSGLLPATVHVPSMETWDELRKQKADEFGVLPGPVRLSFVPWPRRTMFDLPSRMTPTGIV